MMIVIVIDSKEMEDAEDQSRKERLSEILDWLLKMDFTVEDIMEWITNKRKTSPPTRSVSHDHASTSQFTNEHGATSEAIGTVLIGGL